MISIDDMIFAVLSETEILCSKRLDDRRHVGLVPRILSK